jgi:hypothetical protein
MRAATELLSLLQTAGQAAGGSPLWRADEVAADTGPVLPSGFAELDRELPGGGWPLGQLIELLTDDAGIGELSLLAPALAHLAQARRATVWVLPVDGARPRPEAQPVPYAPALATAGLDLARTLFVRPATPRESLWSLEQALHARHLGAVVGWLPPSPGDGDFRALRRLHLLAQRHQALAFVLRSARQREAPSPAVLRLALTSAAGALQVTLLKRRGRPLLDPITLAVRPAHWEAHDAADFAAVVMEGLPAAATTAAAPALPALLD